VPGGKGAQGTEPGAQSTEPGAQSTERGTQGTGHAAKNLKHRKQGAEPGAHSKKDYILNYKVMEDFRFEQLDIWKEAIEVSDMLFDYCDKADGLRFYKFAEQLRAAAMSISNNIAEGSGSYSDKDFANFLNISRRSIFECANILHIFERRKIITSVEKSSIYPKLIMLSKKVTNFRKSLNRS
jgi:four helix bundle protein